MKAKHYIRCPYCDGKIKLNSMDSIDNMLYIKSQPQCVDCEKEFNITINTMDNDYISYEVENKCMII